MKPFTKLYLKFFLISGSLYGIINIATDFLRKGKVNPLDAIIGFIFFGAIVSWYVMITDKRNRKKSLGAKFAEDDYNVHQIDFLPKTKSIEEIYELLTLNDITKKWKFKLQNSGIIGKTRISSHSWGEKIRISEQDDKLRIESKPMHVGVLIDGGKNKVNVIFLKTLIENSKSANICQ